jgi:hypothetical protein
MTIRVELRFFGLDDASSVASELPTTDVVVWERGTPDFRGQPRMFGQVILKSGAPQDAYLDDHIKWLQSLDSCARLIREYAAKGKAVLEFVIYLDNHWNGGAHLSQESIEWLRTMKLPFDIDIYSGRHGEM